MKWSPRWQDEKTEQLRPIGAHCHKCGTRHSWDQSSSVIFAEQTLHLNGSAVRHCYTRRGSDFTRCKTLVPRDFVYTGGCHDGGIIFRPGVAKVKCGNAHDSGHVCHMFCPSPGSSSQTEEDPAHPCRSWAPADIHHYLRIETDARRKDEEGPSPPTFRYNEFIADGSWWDGHLPEVIEAFLRGNKHDNATAVLHAKFLSTYGLKPKDVPLIEWTDDKVELNLLFDVPTDISRGSMRDTIDFEIPQPELFLSQTSGVAIEP